MMFDAKYVAEWYKDQQWYIQARNLPERLGLIPLWINPNDLRPAAQQLDEGYQHGGGWDPFKGFTLDEHYQLNYFGDPPVKPIAYTKLVSTRELVVIYEHAWVAVIQPDRSFEVCRMD
jgi:hypothetical protein